MLKTDKLNVLRINEKEIKIIINKKYGTLKVDNIFFPSLDNVKYFINKLTDIVEEMEESNEV